jgi:O-antigen ligase
MHTLTFSLSLVYIYFIPWESVLEIPGLGSAAKLSGIALSACWLTTAMLTNRVRKPGPLHIVAGLFVLWNVASAFWSADGESTLTHAQTWAEVLTISYIMWDLYTTRARILAGLQAFIIGEYFALGATLVNYFNNNAYYTTYQRFSPSAQSNPDGFGIIAVLGIPIAWYLATTMGRSRMSHVFRVVNYAYIPAGFLGLALSGTRTAMLAGIPGMAFGLASLMRLRPQSRFAALLMVGCGVGALLPQILSLRSFQRLGTTYGELTEGDLNNRTNNWREGFDTFTERPLLGVGSNMYRSINRLGKVAHNSFLSILVELGAIGLALFGAICAIAVFQALRQPKWEAAFWLTLILVWAIGASSLTYEHRKATWLVLTLTVASAAVVTDRQPVRLVAPSGDSES